MSTTAMEQATKFKILFVDNSKTTRFAMTRLLEQKGYVVESAGTGVEAIEKLKANGYHLAIMDLYMPFMNGYEAAKQIRALDTPSKDVPIIALTGSTDPNDMEIAKTAGMNEYIVKSEDNAPLFEAIERLKNLKKL
jgi:CheY-like chemotaxis protein